MSDAQTGVKLGQKVPDFDAHDVRPVEGRFRHSFARGPDGQKRWTILFFYPADFTFV